ncbi:hypothetical protein AVEN_171329-1 [Araneus ventricosus]|uniref:MATH domain-containing protein n=1 Tax=Araneus ventricosus TaxID=182803 RepID=A0A4Y2M4U3_ARAVE|nr:hypothetical protein AVEN_171329-1 [Araneus ventricosus]
MAEASENRMVDIARDVDLGNSAHKFSYSFKLLNLRMTEPWTFRKKFSTGCESGPSSWSCEMVFHKVEDNGKVSFPVTIKRTDSGSNGLDVVVNPQIRDDFGRNLSERWVLQGGSILGGDAITRILEADFSNTEEGFCLILEFQVQIFIFVSSCHSPSTV